MAMKALSEQEYKTFAAALNGEPYDRSIFERATTKIRIGSAIRPEGVSLDREIPGTLREWRKDKAWSIRLIDNHQAACDAAWREYWRVLTSAAHPQTDKGD